MAELLARPVKIAAVEQYRSGFTVRFVLDGHMLVTFVPKCTPEEIALAVARCQQKNFANISFGKKMEDLSEKEYNIGNSICGTRF